jgi:uncharacterized DUF497 family protein
MFDWDDAKAATNAHKHGVTFEEATSVFLDADAIEGDAHSDVEPRFFIVGRSDEKRILTVIFTVRSTSYGKERFRIISARPASRKERQAYTG